MTAAIADGRRTVLHGLTGIRFFAAMMVLLFHFGAGFAGRAGLPRPVTTFLANGYLGVSLFFMLSGFIITYTYDGRLATRTQRADFFAARLSRIYPMYLLALLMALPFAWRTLAPLPALAVLAMVQTWTLPASSLGYSWMMQAWTLSAELFFYLCAPLLLAAVRPASSRALVALAVALAAVMVVLRVPTIHAGVAPADAGLAAWLPIPLVRLTEFAFGMVLCKLFLRHGAALARWSGDLATLANLAVIATLLMLTADGAVMGAAMVLAGLLLVQIAAGETCVTRLLSTRPLLLLGAASYALYLIQAPVRDALRLLPGAMLGQVLNPFVAVALSVVLYKGWEEPARRWLRRRIASPARAAAPERPLLPERPLP